MYTATSDTMVTLSPITITIDLHSTLMIACFPMCIVYVWLRKELALSNYSVHNVFLGVCHFNVSVKIHTQSPPYKECL